MELITPTNTDSNPSRFSTRTKMGCGVSFVAAAGFLALGGAFLFSKNLPARLSRFQLRGCSQQLTGELYCLAGSVCLAVGGALMIASLARRSDVTPGRSRDEQLADQMRECVERSEFMQLNLERAARHLYKTGQLQRSELSRPDARAKVCRAAAWQFLALATLEAAACDALPTVNVGSGLEAHISYEVAREVAGEGSVSYIVEDDLFATQDGPFNPIEAKQIFDDLSDEQKVTLYNSLLRGTAPTGNLRAVFDTAMDLANRIESRYGSQMQLSFSRGRLRVHQNTDQSFPYLLRGVVETEVTTIARDFGITQENRSEYGQYFYFVSDLATMGTLLALDITQEGNTIWIKQGDHVIAQCEPLANSDEQLYPGNAVLPRSGATREQIELLLSVKRRLTQMRDHQPLRGIFLAEAYDKNDRRPPFARRSVTTLAEDIQQIRAWWYLDQAPRWLRDLGGSLPPRYLPNLVERVSADRLPSGSGVAGVDYTFQQPIGSEPRPDEHALAAANISLEEIVSPKLSIDLSEFAPAPESTPTRSIPIGACYTPAMQRRFRIVNPPGSIYRGEGERGLGCIYAAVAVHVFSSGGNLVPSSKWEKLRDLAANFAADPRHEREMRERIDYQDVSLSDYSEKIRQGRERKWWGGGPELYAIAAVLDRPILIYNETAKYQERNGCPLPNSIIYPEGHGQPIFLSRINGNHFMALIPKN